MNRSYGKRNSRGLKPYEVVGAGDLTATVWKTVDAHGEWQYTFNVYRQSRDSGVVSQLYRPADLIDFVKLCQVLAVTLTDDGCLLRSEWNELAELAANLNAVTR